MDKQTKNIALLEDGRIRLKTRRVVTPENEVICIRDGVVYFKLNRDRICLIDVDDYFRFSLWAHRVCFSHADTNVGVVAYDNGYEHRSLPGLIMQTCTGQTVSYRNVNHCDIRKKNLYIRGTN
jgi:hypothetical protein